MDRFDDTTKTLVALQWVDELANKKNPLCSTNSTSRAS